jgi:uncharacterized protein (TIGR02588 family)
MAQRAAPHRPREMERRGGPAEAHESGTGKADAIPMWEWVVALLGLVLVMGSIGFMTYQAMAGDDSPPFVTVGIDAVLPFESGYLVQIRAVNQGGSTAAQVRIEGSLMNGSGRMEGSETVIDYVPAHSHRKGGLFFTHDPRQYTLQLRATGYAKP